jgi:signal transduction histidine kinase
MVPIAHALWLRAVRFAAVLVAALVCAACNPATPAANPRKADGYLYEDTRRLVSFVEAAAVLVEQRGSAAFAEFDPPDSRWRTAPTYLFVYDIDGTCVWHGLNRELVGRNLLSLRDALNKPVVQMIVDIGKKPERDASGWVFYLWEERTEFAPNWKSSYIRKAVAPDGKVYLVGTGSSTIKVEKVFLRDAVDAAARLLEERGRAAAFTELRDPSSRFRFLGSYIFVLDARGRSLVDPAYPTHGGRDMTTFRDAIGRPVVTEVMTALANSDSAWIQFLWPRSGETTLSRKLMYVRKVNANGETLLVGSDFFVATPIWMRP